MIRHIRKKASITDKNNRPSTLTSDKTKRGDKTRFFYHMFFIQISIVSGSDCCCCFLFDCFCFALSFDLRWSDRVDIALPFYILWSNKVAIKNILFACCLCCQSVLLIITLLYYIWKANNSNCRDNMQIDFRFAYCCRNLLTRFFFIIFVVAILKFLFYL